VRNGKIKIVLHWRGSKADATTVAKIDAIQAEFSPFETLHEEDGLIPTARELGVAFVAYGPLGHGWLVEDFPYQSPEDFNEEDYRRESK
jgi:aryl-alcohol dehydrogenase-like predicted oxidoreductase